MKKIRILAAILCLVLLFAIPAVLAASRDNAASVRTLNQGSVSVSGSLSNRAVLQAEEVDDPFADQPAFPNNPFFRWLWRHWWTPHDSTPTDPAQPAPDDPGSSIGSIPLSDATFYDISVKDRGEEVHFDEPVTVTIRDVEIPADGSLQIIHILDDENVIEDAYFSGRAAEISAGAFVAAFPDASEAAFKATGHRDVVFVEYFTTADGSLCVQDEHTVSFETRSFSVFILTETTLEASIEATDGNTYQVSVSFDVRANIPTDAYLEVTEITEDSPDYAYYLETSARKMGYRTDGVEYLRLFDISLVSANTRERYQPAFPVDVRISLLDRAQGAAGLSVVHFGDTPELLEIANADGDVCFTADHFSVFSLGEGVHLDTYKFFVPTDATQTSYEEYTLYMEHGQTTFTQIVKAGQELVIPRLPSIPGNTNSTFEGWHIGTESGGSVTLDPVLFDFSNIPTPSDTEYHLYARFSTFAYVLFHEQYSGATDSWPITTTRRGEIVNGVATVHIEDVTVSYDDPDAQQNLEPGEEPPPPAMAFRGWTTKENINPDNTIDFNAPLMGDASGNVTISENLELYPVFSSINWLSYSSAPAGTGATYFPPEFLYVDEGLASLSSRLPERKGYTFAGWYTEREGGVQVANASGVLNTSASFPAGSGLRIENGELMLDKNVLIYGHWTPAPATYTIVIWRQCVDDDKNAADADKTYDFAESARITSVSEAIATVPDTYKQRSGGEYTGFHYARCDADETVNGNDTTVLNVYYDRDLKTIVFNANGHTFTGAGTAYVPATNDNGTQYAYINGSYVQLTRLNNPVYSADGGQTQYSGDYYCETTSNSNITEYGIVNGNIVQLTRAGSYNNRYWTYNGQRYDGTRYVRNTTNNASNTTRYMFDSSSATMVPLTQYSWTYNNELYTGTRYTVVNNALSWTGLYGQTLAQAGYSWDSVNAYAWRESPNGGTTQTLLDSFIHENAVYNLYNNGNSGTATIYHYRQQLDGTYTVDDRETAHGSNGTFNFSDKFNGFEVVAYSSNGEGFRSSGGHHTVSSGNSVQYNTTLHVYHRRKSYTLSYLDSDDSHSVYPSSSVLYEQPLTEFQPADPTPTKEGYEFSGWFYDDACTKGVDFSRTMPSANMAIYAGWSSKWHLIKIDPNGGQLQSQDSTWFWKIYGTTESVVEYTGTKREYIESLNGTWYYAVKDRAYYGLTDLWDDRENDIHERTTYYTQDISDPAIVDLNVKYEYMHDAYRYAGWYEVHPDGTENLYNFSTRIDHDILLKLHWKQVGTYYIRYDAGDLGTLDGNDSNEDTFKFLDSADYMDRSEIVITRTAVANDGEHRNFIGWKIRGDNSNTIYYPGQAFEFQSRFALTQMVNGQEKKYLILDAVYTYIGTATIIYDANGGVVNAADVDYGEPTDPTAPVIQTSCAATSASVMNLINNSGITVANGAGFVRENAQIVGWNTAPDASGTHFDLGGDYYVDTAEPVRLYAEWGVKVYFDKNNPNANWGGTWASPTYTWDPVREQYYTYAVIGKTVDEPSYIPVSSNPSETFNYWTLERNSLEPVEYDFTTPITGETTLYGFWRLPIEIRVHAVDSSDATPVNMDATWLREDPSYVQISGTTPVELGAAANAAVYTNVPSSYDFAFTCVCETIDGIATAKPISRLYYNTSERAVWVRYADGTEGRLGENDTVWFVYFDNPKTVNIRYKVMNLDGTLTDAVMGRTGYPTSAELYTYAMHETGHVNRAMYWANNEDYKYYAYAVGAPNATTSGQMRVITGAANSDADGSRPALTLDNTWSGFRYSVDGAQTWSDCGRDIEMYVIYYTTTAKPVVITVNERTVGRLADLSEYFDYTVTVTETETTYQRTDTFNNYFSATPSSLGTPTVVGTPAESTVSSSTFQLKHTESSPFTLFYEESVPAYQQGYGYSRTCTYTVRTQTITVTQTAKTGFETVNDASASTPLVYTYTTASDSVNSQVTFTNTRTPLEVEVHVAQISGSGVVLKDDTLRKTTPADYTVELPYDTSVALSSTSPVDPFRGSLDEYVFQGIFYGTRTGESVTLYGSVSDVTYDLLTGRDYGDIFLNDNESLLLGGNEIYYVYSLKPRLVFVEEEGDGSLVMINPVRYNGSQITLNGVAVDQNLRLDVTDADFVIKNSGSYYRLPPKLDGVREVLSLDYVKIGTGDANVTRTGDLAFLSENRELHLRVVDGVAQYSSDGTTYTAFSGEPVIYVIYRDQANNALKIIRTDGAADQDFWYTVTCPDTTEVRVCLPKGVDSVTIKGVPYGNYRVTEQTEWSWRYASESVQNTRVYGPDDTRPTGAMVGYSEVTFTGNRNNDRWLNGYDSEVNRFHP